MKQSIVLIAMILVFILTGTAFADTIQAKPVTLSMDRLEGHMIRTDLEYKEGDKMRMTLYVPERFDAAAILSAKVGDVIVTDGEEIVVKSVEADGPDLLFNKGTENEMLFCDAGFDEFEHVEDNDFVPWIRLGTMEQEILDYYPILDGIDPISGEILEEYRVYRGDRLKELLQNPDAVGFDCKNVDVVYDHSNQPVLILRYYSPAQ